MRFLIFVLFIIFVSCYAQDFNDSGSSIEPITLPTSVPTLHPSYLRSNSSTVAVNSSNENLDRVTMAAIFLLLIPAILGFSFSFSLVNKSLFVSQRLPTSSPSAHEEEFLEWDLSKSDKSVEENRKTEDETSLKKSLNTFQSWFTPSSVTVCTEDNLSNCSDNGKALSQVSVENTLQNSNQTFLEVIFP